MCGIAGGVFWGGRTTRGDAESAVAVTVSALGHRGPDGHGVMTSAANRADDRKPFAVLGHTRLAIIDVSPAGAQPMGGQDGSPFITYNGETYNFADLKRELEASGAQFTSKTDTEVLLRGYNAWGIDVLTRLRGMFAFAIWDERAQRLLVARDRLGIKPLYFFKGDGFLLFASEVRALLATDLIPRTLDPMALWQYLGYQAVPAPRTLVNGVRALEPGHWMTVDAGGTIAEGEYWRMLDATATPIDISPTEARRRVGDLLRDAVASHMVSDVPVGAFLSGGIDSSAVVGLMREAGHVPRTFSVGFDERAFDETSHAALIATRFQTEHTHIQLTGDDLLDQLPGALRAMDQPTGDAVNTYVVSGAVRARGITVAQSGLGGDELFGGYPSFARLSKIADLARIWGKSPDALRSLAATAVRALGRSSVQASKAAAVLESDGSVSAMFPLTRRLLSVEQRLSLLDETVLATVQDRADPYERLLERAYADAPTAGLFAQISFAEARTYMHDVLLRDTDQMSMAHSLEVRVPLLDHRLVDFVTSLPDAIKQTNGVPKRLLVESLGGLLPDSIIHRPKQGFTLPFDPWMRGPLRLLCEERLGERGLAGRGIFKPAQIQRLWTSFLSGGKDVSWSRLWALVVLDSWLDRHGLTVAS
jgi:asparagine synthase (glutamine-hydrolysing)